MTIYFIEISDKVYVHKVDMSERHRFWLAHPTAKEISKKQYEQTIKFFKTKKASEVDADSLKG